MHMMIFGCGYSGTAIANSFSRPGSQRRRHDALAEKKRRRLNRQGIEAFVFDGETLDAALLEAMSKRDPSRAVDRAGQGRRSAAPAGRRAHRDADAEARMDRLSLDRRRLWRPQGRLDRRGDVDPARVRRARSSGWRPRTAGWRSATSLGVPTAVLRLSGIYGPGRNAFCNLDKGTARGWSSRTRSSTASASRISAPPAASLPTRGLGGIYQCHRRRARPAAGCGGGSRTADGRRAAAGNAVRDGRTVARWHAPSMARTSVSRMRRLKALGFRFSYPGVPDVAGRTLVIGRWRG